MILILYLIFWAMHVWCILIKRNSWLLNILTVLFLGLLFISNSGVSGDAYKYKIDFEHKVFAAGWSEIGYTALKNFLYLIGIEHFRGLLTAIFLLCSSLIYMGLKPFQANYHLLFTTVMAFIFPTCSVAIRFFIALSVMIFSFPFLVAKRYPMYLGCVLIATMFHRASLLYLILILCRMDRQELINRIKKFSLAIVVIVALLCVGLTYLFGEMPFLGLIRSVVLAVFPSIGVKIDSYMGTITHFGALIFFGIYLSGLIFACLMRNLVHVRACSLNGCRQLQSWHLSAADQTEMEPKELGFSKELCDLVDLAVRINLVLALVLPFIVLNLVYYRLLMFVSLVNALVYGLVLRQKKTKGYKYKIRLDRMTVIFIFNSVLWLIPEIVGIHSITIKGMISASLFG